MPVVSSLARKGGATLACVEDAERMLSGGELVGVWPEGFKGIGKPFSERYKLQRFGRGGFVSAALRTGVPIIPLSVVGAEEIYPLVGNVRSLARLLGVPYIPITPFFPWLGPLGMVPLPSKWILEFGEPIRTDSYDPGEAEDPMLVFNVTDQVRETIQHTLFDLLRERDGVFSWPTRRGRSGSRPPVALPSVPPVATSRTPVTSSIRPPVASSTAPVTADRPPVTPLSWVVRFRGVGDALGDVLDRLRGVDLRGRGRSLRRRPGQQRGSVRRHDLVGVTDGSGSSRCGGLERLGDGDAGDVLARERGTVSSVSSSTSRPWTRSIAALASEGSRASW